jgi:putative endonuclease
MPASHNTTLGKTGEDLACAELQRRGYAIVARRFRTRVGEIDIIARQGGALVFVEVKTRSSDRYGAPAEAVGWRKQRSQRAMAREYFARVGPPAGGCRFEVVAVLLAPGARPRVDVLAAS